MRGTFTRWWQPVHWLDQGWYLASKLGVTGAVAIVVLVGTVAVAALLERRRSEPGVEPLVEYLETRGMEPEQLVARAARSRRLIFVTDVPGAPEPKELAIAAIESAAANAGLDVVALQVPASEQPYIDEYLRSNPENPSILVGRPAALRASLGEDRAYLEIYRAVWRLNDQLAATRRMRILALDFDVARSGVGQPRPAEHRLADIDDYMETRLDEEVFVRNPRARVLLFLNGYHGLQSGRGVARISGGGTAEIEWLATRLRAKYPGDVYTILIDGAQPRSAPPASYGGTRAAEQLRRRFSGSGPVAVPIDEHFDYLSRPILENGGPGITLELRPDGYRLRDVADGYVYVSGR